MPCFEPFRIPCDKSTIPNPVDLDETHQKKYEEVLEHFQQLEEIPLDDKSTEISSLDDSEKSWLTRECLLRYLRATKWHVDEAIKRIVATLIWRRTFGVDPESSLTEELISSENETGKELLFGFDNDSRPCLALKPGRQNTTPSHRQVQCLVYLLERTIDFMPSGQDQLALVIDFQSVKGMPKRDNKIPSLSTGREVLSILQNHYPERLGKALMLNIPWAVWVFLKLIGPFMDPLTREKLVYQQPPEEYIPKEQLEAMYGGDVDFEYDHEMYWPALARIAAERRADYMTQFKLLGKKIGLSEADLRKPLLDETQDKSQQESVETSIEVTA